jgi:hypothetical protein
MLSSDWVMKGEFFLSLLFFALSPSPGNFPLGIPYLDPLILEPYMNTPPKCQYNLSEEA